MPNPSIRCIFRAELLFWYCGGCASRIRLGIQVSEWKHPFYFETVNPAKSNHDQQLITVLSTYPYTHKAFHSSWHPRLPNLDGQPVWALGTTWLFVHWSRDSSIILGRRWWLYLVCFMNRRSKQKAWNFWRLGSLKMLLNPDLWCQCHSQGWVLSNRTFNSFFFIHPVIF